MVEIKIRIGKNGKIDIKVPQSQSQKAANFTEKLAKDLGKVEERHKGTTHTKTETNTQQQVGQ